MFEIRAVRQIRLLASPVRQAIIDALESSGPLSVAELGKILGYASDALYHHLRKLARGGLITASRQPGSHGKRCAVFALKAIGSRLRYDPSDRQNRNAINAIAATMLRDASRTFAKAFKPPVAVHGRKRELWVGRRTAWLTQSQLEQLNDRLAEIVRFLENAGPKPRGTKLYALTFALSPFGRQRSSVDTKNRQSIDTSKPAID
jgi:predicted ArsR family transcriptional regulator